MNARTSCSLALVGLFLVLMATSTAGSQFGDDPEFNVVFITDGPSDQMEQIRSSLEREILAVLGEETRLVFSEAARTTDWTMPSVDRALQRALDDPATDLIVGVGSMTGVAVARRKILPKPVLLPYAAPELQGLPRRGETSGRTNLAYVGNLLEFERAFREFEEVVPFERLAFLIGQEFVQHLDDPERPVRQASQRVGIRTRLVVVGDDVAEALAAIPEDSDAVFIGPLPRWNDRSVQLLIDGINQRALPSYAGGGAQWVERGALATMLSTEDEDRRLRRAALYARRIFLGQPASQLRVTFESRPELVINMDTARAIGSSPRFAVITEATVIGGESGARGPLLRLEEVMRDAVRANLDVMSQRIGIDVGEENVKQSRGEWFFDAVAAGEYRWTDPDITSPFTDAERQFTWGIEGSQLLYSADSHGGLRASRDEQAAVVDDYNSVRLDFMLEAGVAYLNVLRAKNAERVSRDNLRLTRNNLALAETRFGIGSVGRDEVIRWKILIAESRATLIEANALRNQAEIDLNRILNRPLEEPFRTPPESEVRSVLPGSDSRLTAYLEDPGSFRVLRAFMADEGVRNSPEIQAIDQRIAAQGEFLKAERRTLGIPDIAIVGGFRHIPHVAGAGSQSVPSNGVFPTRDTFSWSIGVAGTLTLFDGTQNYSRIRQNGLIVDQLQTDRASIAQRVQQRVRAELHLLGSSFANIQLSQEAADAAVENLELVTESYRRGAVDIIRLIDAQNQAVTSDLAATNARYDFLINALRVERAAGSFSLEGTPEERDDFIRRLNAYASSQGAPVPR